MAVLYTDLILYTMLQYMHFIGYSMQTGYISCFRYNRIISMRVTILTTFLMNPLNKLSLKSDKIVQYIFIIYTFFFNNIITLSIIKNITDILK